MARLDAAHFAGDPAEACGHLVFAAALGQELHADANAEERPALPAHGLGQRSTMPGKASRPRRQSAKAPTPGSTTRSAARTASGSSVTAMASVCPLSRAARSKALAAECRLPEP